MTKQMIEALTGDEIADILYKDYDGNHEQEYHLHQDDRFYKPLTKKDEKILRTLLLPVRLLPYKPELRDCDDYATFAAAAQRLLLPGRAFGRCDAVGFDHVNGNHALNFWINAEHELVFYEPQQNKIIEADLNDLDFITFYM